MEKLKCMVMFQYSIRYRHFGIMEAGLNSGISVRSLFCFVCLVLNDASTLVGH